jgi:chromosome segregation ATPase
MLFAKEKAQFAARIEELESTNASLTEQLTAITTERDAHAARVTEMEATHATAIRDMQSAHETAITAARAESETNVDTRISTAVTDALASAGVPASELPARGSTEQTASADEQIEALQAKISESKDPLEKGKLAAAIIDIMDAKKAKSKN